MKYLISKYGLGITVGFLKQQESEEMINLAHNLFDAHAYHSLFHGAINLTSIKEFKRLLIYKEYFANCIKNRGKEFNEMKFLRAAIKRAKEILSSEVGYENFMMNMYHSTKQHNIGVYHDEVDYEC